MTPALTSALAAYHEAYAAAKDAQQRSDERYRQMRTAVREALTSGVPLTDLPLQDRQVRRALDETLEEIRYEVDDALNAVSRPTTQQAA